ncbi:hypothetical protein [Pseudomonas phage ZCPS1]|uniref:Uncharacterized protein n=3 Tax=Bruynoghevirus TaxID=545932 RepID=A0A6G9LFM4_9CAUD|nr:hypothetical protein BN425_orf_07 [Pseudomonas phage vB_PaeP_p2-10_Or1]AFD10686.1 hypothetical protein I7C_008 [Pseudomonas phage MR299-2]ATW62323.1 hypothetical protein Delta_p08 [Pseudomonas phage Delta]QIQ64410.1 hypothetical protein Epa1_p08 [Pseudomonas phage Epa1]QIQ66493.1 hypothetical protein clash_61 [Pseudomonas phage clash]QIQ67464.1 hypothetical protein otherone_61 [Pseudomonas phage otherone]QSH71731.1 hypothetical protein [Pseudomonas phage vB_PaeP_fHoPae04]QYC95364.1 putati
MSIQSTYAIDEDLGLFIRKDTQDVESILSANAEERHSGVNTNRKDNLRKVASIPLVVVEALRNRPMSEGGPIDLNLIGCDPDHAARFTRWLNDRDNYRMRTSEARV